MAPHIDELDIEDLDDAIAHAEPALARLAGASLFVTGGTGFVGRWLLAVLVRANATLNLDLTVTALTRSKPAFSRRCPQLASDPMIQWIEGDVRTFEFPKGKFSHVVHAATDTSVEADRQPLKLIDTIVNGTRRALEFSLAAGAQRFLLLSSGAAYGSLPDHLNAFSEDYPGACATTDRRASYGQAKRLSEQLATIFHADLGLDIIIARLFSFVGPGIPLDAHFAMGNFIRNAVDGRELTVTGDGSPLRSYLYAGDLAAWLLHLLVAGRAGALYNVGSDEAISIADLAARIARVVPTAKGYVIQGTAPPDTLRARYVPAITRARNELGLDVWTPLDEGIARTARWAASRQKPDNAPSVAELQEARGSDRKLVFVVDIDGVIASLTPKNDYAIASPLTATIDHINRLYDSGHRIILFTARGSATGIDWSDITRQQLQDWGIKYHDIRFGKPAADFYVDDRALSLAEFHNIVGAIT